MGSRACAASIALRAFSNGVDIFMRVWWGIVAVGDAREMSFEVDCALGGVEIRIPSMALSRSCWNRLCYRN